MKLGLVTDIHEHVEHLRTALRCFDKERVDQIVVIGDLFKLGEQIDETCWLLADAGAIGVWGNHDFGLCVGAAADEELAKMFSPEVIRYMQSLQPRLELAGCHFSHVEPWLDPEDIADLWYFEGPPDEPAKLRRIFDAVPHRHLFAGHYHRWLLATPEELTNWDGGSPIRLQPDERCFIVVGAVCEGRFAIFDTDSRELTPFEA